MVDESTNETAGRVKQGTGQTISLTPPFHHDQQMPLETQTASTIKFASQVKPATPTTDCSYHNTRAAACYFFLCSYLPWLYVSCLPLYVSGIVCSARSVVPATFPTEGHDLVFFSLFSSDFFILQNVCVYAVVPNTMRWYSVVNSAYGIPGINVQQQYIFGLWLRFVTTLLFLSVIEQSARTLCWISTGRKNGSM